MRSAREVLRALTALGTAEKAEKSARFFKTGPGEYGHGDLFLGVTVPEQRRLVEQVGSLDFDALDALLSRPEHEARLMALLLLVRRYERAADDAVRAECFLFYVARRARVNNWDLVDSSAPQIVGAHLLKRRRGLLSRLVRSPVMWDRRIAMVSTLTFIRAGDAEETFGLARALFDDPEDLMHKATGWMLREVGKHVGPDALRGFLREHLARLPRTALRYAVERFTPEERKAWLTGTA